MQGDMLDAILDEVDTECAVLDPFVGSGTTMTEALLRGLDFTGIDINPLAVLVCEAKAAIDSGVSLHGAAAVVLQYLAQDVKESVDVEFANLEKWFSLDAAIHFSRLRRSIQQVQDAGARKVMWVVFADTIRLCSNSRTSTYKLHIRPDGSLVDVLRIDATFRANLRNVLERAREYSSAIEGRKRRPKVKVVCNDILRARVTQSRKRHDLLVTSPPYGDNRTTIPYGQFSYLALGWIPKQDLPQGWDSSLANNSSSIDSASLGGSIRNFDYSEILSASPAFKKFIAEAKCVGKEHSVRKVSAFMADYFSALQRLRPKSSGGSHWVLTTGNRRAAGLVVPFDRINEDIVRYLEGTCVASIKRHLPVKRMPSRNSMGDMITSETTLIAEFV
ncbi:hypothetical protein [Xanthomonas bonasiae]|uniref:hypothetical protein n=1 Tax=Xanthomonas bonasiae TaxID=2810351 RepID=UPI00197EB5CE|nr:hypothetical protein [Xanthomonas bonasiae]MBN6111891.1 hypothetical protein [Xanthomonas bonasiae]